MMFTPIITSLKLHRNLKIVPSLFVAYMFHLKPKSFYIEMRTLTTGVNVTGDLRTYPP
jgi:hypothetical protein